MKTTKLNKLMVELKNADQRTENLEKGAIISANILRLIAEEATRMQNQQLFNAEAFARL